MYDVTFPVPAWSSCNYGVICVSRIDTLGRGEKGSFLNWKLHYGVYKACPIRQVKLKHLICVYLNLSPNFLMELLFTLQKNAFRLVCSLCMVPPHLIPCSFLFRSLVILPIPGTYFIYIF